MLKTILFFVALTFANSTAEARSATRSEIDTIRKDVMPCLKTFKKSYRFYHYSKIEKMRKYSPQLTDTQLIEQHLELWSEYAWNPQQKGRAGLYTATNPVGSSDYGGSYFYLYRVELPEGTTYFDASDYATQQECEYSKKSRDLLRSEGCKDPNLRTVLYGNALRENESCIHFIRSIFKKLKFRGYAYQYDESEVKGCDQSNLAFVWNDLRDLPASSFAMFTPELPTNESRLQEAMEMETLAHYLDSSIWPQLRPLTSKNPQSAEVLLRQFIFGCETLATVHSMN